MFSIRPAILTLHVQLLEHGTVYGLWCMRNSRTLRIQYRNYRNGSFEEETNVPVLDPPFWNIAIRDLVFFHFVGLDWVEDLARGKTRAFAPEKKNWSEKRRRMGSFPTTLLLGRILTQITSIEMDWVYPSANTMAHQSIERWCFSVFFRNRRNVGGDSAVWADRISLSSGMETSCDLASIFKNKRPR